MTSQEASHIYTTFPETPGVYFFRHGGNNGEILYIGKATSLRDRVRSYFAKDIYASRGPKIVTMLEEADAITYEQTDSVLEALLLESHLIKKHQPAYNTKEKDDKSFYYIVITKENFPRVLLVRGRDLLVSRLQKDKKEFIVAQSFGPFPSGQTLKDALKIIRRIFPFRDTCTPFDELSDKSKAKPCFNRQIGLCPGVCTGEIDKTEYNSQISYIKDFLGGNKKGIIKTLTKEMKAYAQKHEFEHAQHIKKQLFALTHIHDVSLIKEETFKDKTSFRIESYDIAHMSGSDVVGVMTVVEQGEIVTSQYRKFLIKEDPGVNDTKALKEIVTRRFGHNEWRFPDLIVVDGGVAQKRAVESVLHAQKLSIPVVSVVKDERHKPKQILGDKQFLVHEKSILLSNAEAHRYAISFHKTLRNKKMRA